MQERQVTIAGETHKVPEPFLVMATQNPIETEGTYPLPEAQVDRFMMKVLVGYPSEEEEFVIVERVTGAGAAVAAVATTEQLAALQRECRTGYVDPSLIQYAVRLVAATRDPERFGIKDLAQVPHVRREPARVDPPDRGRARARVPARPRLRAARGRDRHGARRAAPPPRARRTKRSPKALAPDELVQRVMQHIPAPEKPLETHVRVAASRCERLSRVLRRRLEWTVIRRLDGLLHGDYRTLFRGFGLDLADLREYQYHDDVRHIDWNVTARLQTPYVREYNEDREVTAWFLLDSQPVGRLRLAGRAASARSSVEFVTVLARLLTRHGNRVGALFYGDDVDTVIPARSGRRHVLHILHRMLARPERTQSRRDRPRRAPADRAPDDAAALARLRRLRLHQRAGLGASRSRTSRSATRSSRCGCTIRSRWSCPTSGCWSIQDAETGEQLFVDTHDRGFRRRFAAAAERREKELRAAFRQRGRRRARARDRRRSRRRDHALRRPAQAPQPARRRRRAAAAPRGDADDVPLARHAVARSPWCRCSSRCTSGCCAGGRRLALRYASLAMVKDAMGAGQSFRRHVPPVLFLLALIAMIVAIARPAAVVTLPSQHETVILAIDVSGSMRATDVEPNRLAAAQAAAQGVRRRAAAAHAHRRRVVRRHRARRAAADAEPRGHPRRDRPLPAAARHRGRQRHPRRRWRRSSRTPEFDLRVREPARRCGEAKRGAARRSTSRATRRRSRSSRCRRARTRRRRSSC